MPRAGAGAQQEKSTPIHSYQVALSQDGTLRSETSVLSLQAQNDVTLRADPY